MVKPNYITSLIHNICLHLRFSPLDACLGALAICRQTRPMYKDSPFLYRCDITCDQIAQSVEHLFKGSRFKSQSNPFTHPITHLVICCVFQHASPNQNVQNDIMTLCLPYVVYTYNAVIIQSWIVVFDIHLCVFECNILVF